MIGERHKAALVEILGADGVVQDSASMAAYENGARYDRGSAAFVLRPRGTAEVSACVAYCVREHIALIPQSGNTGLVSGSTPDTSGAQVVLSLDRMTRIFDPDIDNRSIHVDAGTRLSDINGRLEQSGLFFPIDLGADPRVGGMLATNTGGSRFLKYGDVRRNTLGVKVVLADEAGTVVDLLSGLRKNNTGVDWKQLFVGTSGAFGIVTECVLNLERLPRQVSTAYLVPRTGTAVIPLLRAMEERLGSYLSAFEGMSGNAIAAALAHVPSLRNPFQNGDIPNYVILAEVSRSWLPRDDEQPLDAVLETVLAEVWEAEGAPLANAFVGPAREMWALRHALSEGVKHAGRLIAFDLSFRRADVLAFCDWMKLELPSHFVDVAIFDFGHIGDGGVHFNLVVDEARAGPVDIAFERRLRDWVYSIAVDRFGGSFSAEHGVGRKNQAYYDLYTQKKHKDLAAGLKQLTSPGRLGSVCFG
ncbi:MAG: FAD-binding oxidoreductase [Mesorhizobium sp.]|uniref:FAD-binding oxidoreductase n=1 Tax=Mesorhizobium sp. M7A.F.Ca.ET.027.02.1.1 TaxID=2496655 RepID=UPI000FD24073|nr:FAD-binding oxidoreductase [Mesorhizobium sp. M7A.F.Ca.ET.027.02.1.1]RVD09280.1 FAD-binding oxidoreductase [Mesorhizobium sp. M7A.F.Ca.ET.027.02.1.1]RWC25363.1 MAG: FAD-binding oxidoreductase [Mesorhizobium sp.]RWD01363.1 MAG: FAD-binding oxidoreductase [Mesorhizobium sp.]